MRLPSGDRARSLPSGTESPRSTMSKVLHRYFTPSSAALAQATLQRMHSSGDLQGSGAGVLAPANLQDSVDLDDGAQPVAQSPYADQATPPATAAATEVSIEQAPPPETAPASAEQAPPPPAAPAAAEHAAPPAASDDGSGSCKHGRASQFPVSFCCRLQYVHIDTFTSVCYNCLPTSCALWAAHVSINSHDT